MFWLQPGGQRIGDQLFDAFAYAENRAAYITSWKAEASKAPADGFKLFNRDTIIFWTAILSASLGFISQFIGFRGLHGSVALYQLAITLFMAIIRAALRSKRLSRDSNCLECFGRDIEG